jgi:hypothetical protein
VKLTVVRQYFVITGRFVVLGLFLRDIEMEFMKNWIVFALVSLAVSGCFAAEQTKTGTVYNEDVNVKK